MPTRSAALERFRLSFFEDPDSARQGLDTPALAGLVGEERERAEAMLIAFLPDSRAIIGLGGWLFWKLIRAMARIQMPTYER